MLCQNNPPMFLTRLRIFCNLVVLVHLLFVHSLEVSILTFLIFIISLPFFPRFSVRYLYSFSFILSYKILENFLFFIILISSRDSSIFNSFKSFINVVAQTPLLGCSNCRKNRKISLMFFYHPDEKCI